MISKEELIEAISKISYYDGAVTDEERAEITRLARIGMKTEERLAGVLKTGIEVMAKLAENDEYKMNVRLIALGEWAEEHGIPALKFAVEHDDYGGYGGNAAQEALSKLPEKP